MPEADNTPKELDFGEYTRIPGTSILRHRVTDARIEMTRRQKLCETLGQENAKDQRKARGSKKEKR